MSEVRCVRCRAYSARTVVRCDQEGQIQHSICVLARSAAGMRSNDRRCSRTCCFIECVLNVSKFCKHMSLCCAQMDNKFCIQTEIVLLEVFFWGLLRKARESQCRQRLARKSLQNV